MDGEGRDADSVLLDVARAMMAISVRAVAVLPGDLSAVQLRALTVLSGLEEANLAELGAALGMSPSSTSRLCDRLVAREVVQRRVSVRTRREVVVSLTERGATVLAEYDLHRISALRTVVDRLPADQRCGVITALRDFAAAVSTRAHTGRHGNA